jgi:hypothetical protein
MRAGGGDYGPVKDESEPTGFFSMKVEQENSTHW